MTSKLNSELVTKAVDDILAYSAGETIKKGDAEIVGKKRKFTESIELQVMILCACFSPTLAPVHTQGRGILDSASIRYTEAVLIGCFP